MKKAYLLLSTIAMTASPYAAQAQTASAPAAATDAPAAEIVVTGTAGGRAAKRMDASFAITSVSGADLVKVGNMNSADVLNMVPGVWVESSGGVAGTNIMVRGLPSTGDSPFVSFQLMGNPIFGTASLSFMDNSSIYRDDLTTKGVEAVNGGTGAVYSIGEAGLTVNHTLVEGTDETKGEVKGTITSYGTKRVDAIISGKLADDLNFMVGGYATSSQGPRSTQFDSEVGQQITASLTKHFDGGKLTIYSRYTDDHGAWYLPFAYGAGVNEGTYTQLGNYSRYVTLNTGATSTQTFDLGQGRGWKGTMSGVNFQKDLGDGWNVTAKAGYTQGNANTLGLVNDGSAETVAAVMAANPTITGIYSNTPGNTTALAGSSYVQSWGQWVVLKQVKSLTDELSITKSIAGNDLTAGYYGSDFSSNDFWSIGNMSPMLVQANGPFVNMTTSSGNLSAHQGCLAIQNTYVIVNGQKVSSGAGCWTYDIQDSGTTHINALYLSDTFHINEQLKLDAGLRNEWNHTNFLIYSNDIAGAYSPYPDLTTPSKSYVDHRSHLSWTGALTYQPDHSMSVYGRISKGYFNPNFDDFRNTPSQSVIPATSSVMQYEMGFKYSAHGTFVSVTPYYYHFVGASGGAVFGSVPVFSDNVNVKGIELQGNTNLGNGLKLAGLATLQQSKIAAGSTDATNIGNEYPRQPKFAAHVSPSYDFAVGSAKASVFGTVSYEGSRYTDNTDSVPLPAFTTIALGATVKTHGVELGLFADNLTNSHGLTEGDPRATPGNATDARPIFGRSVRFSAGYKF